MPDLKLLTLLEAAQPSRLEDALQPFFGPGAEPVAIESTRLQAPLCYWVVYRSGTQRVTLKSFFSEANFARYSARLTEYYPDQIGQPGHPAGGLAFLPALNGILCQFPCDPALLGLRRCLDGAWIAQALRRPEAEPLEPEVVN